MSKQLAISAAFSTFAMAAFALFAAPLANLDSVAQDSNARAQAGVATIAAAELPAFQLPPRGY